MTEITLYIIDAHIQQPQLIKTSRKAVNSYELMKSLKSQVTFHFRGNTVLVFLN